MKPTAILALVFSDGSIGRMQLYVEPSDENIAAAVKSVEASNGPVREWHRVEASDFSDTDFKEAWVLNDEKKVVVDIQKARALTKARLRQRRKKFLQALDVEFLLALETGKDTSDIVQRKRRLRDITLLPDTASTLDELRAIKCDCAP